MGASSTSGTSPTLRTFGACRTKRPVAPLKQTIPVTSCMTLSSTQYVDVGLPIKPVDKKIFTWNVSRKPEEEATTKEEEERILELVVRVQYE